MSNTSLKTTAEWQEWRNINWLKVERQVFKLQKRIYNASKCGNFVTVRKLQKTLIKSWYARLLIVRGLIAAQEQVDGLTVLSPEKGLVLAKGLKLNSKVKSKSSTIQNYILQRLIEMAMEAQWEVKLGLNSGELESEESCQDAVKTIFHSVKLQPKYVLKADINKCFDCINHTQILKKLTTYTTLNKRIRYSLKGGLISPLRTNMAIHAIEERIKEYAETVNVKSGENGHQMSKANKSQGLTLVHSAGNLAIAHEDMEVVEKCQQIITECLSDMGIELKPSQIRIFHTLYKNGEEKPGVDFLGFNIRQYKVSKNHSKLGFKTQIKPSAEKIRSHYRQISKVIDKHKSASQVTLIRKLNSMIRGWVKYYSKVVSRKTFKDLDSLIFQKLWRWAKRRHPNQNNSWISQKYWQTMGNNKKEFSCISHSGSQVRLFRYADFLLFDTSNFRKNYVLKKRMRLIRTTRKAELST